LSRTVTYRSLTSILSLYKKGEAEKLASSNPESAGGKYLLSSFDRGEDEGEESKSS